MIAKFKVVPVAGVAAMLAGALQAQVLSIPAAAPAASLGATEEGNVARAEPQVVLIVNADRPMHRKAGGIGASWHAIRVETRFDGPERYKYDVRHEGPQGSAVGANPPLDSAAWKDIYRLGTRLGLDWLRVEMDRRMYEPQKGQFDWDNEEMRTLYHILDWCQQNNADVFLTEMWRDVDWLAYPEVHPLLSAPNSLEDFADGLAALADHLVREKHYTCIQWLCIAHELTEDKLKQPGFKFATAGRVTVSPRQPEFRQTLPPRSLSVFTAYDLAPDAPGVIAE